MDGVLPAVTLLGMGSPNVAKVVIALEEVGRAWDLRYVDVFAGEQFGAEIRRLNRNAKLPILVDGPLILGESGAILIHLAESSGMLLPQDNPARAVALQWLMFQMSAFGPVSGQAIHFSAVNRDDSYARGRSRRELARLCAVIEEQLGDHRWIAGDTCSIADIAHYPWARTLQRFFPRLLDRPGLQRWMAAMASRAAVVRAYDHMDTLSRRDRLAMKAASPAQLDRYFGRTESVWGPFEAWFDT
jgi:GST-like protein